MKILFARNAQSISKNYHEVILILKILQTKPQVNNTNINYYDLCYTIIKNRDENEIVDNQNENDFISFNDFITPNYYIGIKNFNEILR